MPCYYTGSAEGDAKLDAKEAHKELTKTTKLLCQLCNYIENSHDGVVKLPKNVKEWWKKHQQIDNKKMK